jgi:glycosyltransferase involved in cell wall biosynthesis
MVSRLYRFALKRAHAVVFLNPDDIHDFVSWRICDSSKSFELGGIGVDLQEWQSKAPVTYPVTFLFIGRLLREKGIQEFVDAAHVIKSRHPSVQFVVLGDVDTNPGGIGAEQMRNWVKEGLLAWPGHVPVQAWLEKASVFVLPSYREGVPRSTQEAMALGRPIITTDVPGCRQTVEHGKNGFLVPVRDAEALARTMYRFIKKPDLIGSMGRESRRLAEERFDVHVVNAKLMDVLGLDKRGAAR